MSSPPPYLAQNCASPYTQGEILRRWLWLLVQATVFRWSPRPCHTWRAWLLRLFGASIPTPKRVVIFPTVRILNPACLRLADRAMIGPYVRIWNQAMLDLRYGANISQNCHLCTSSHDYRRWSMPLFAHPIVIGENAWVCADVFVGPGVTIGELCVVGARSVVVKDLPARMVCAGNPCKPIKERPDPV